MLLSPLAGSVQPIRSAERLQHPVVLDVAAPPEADELGLEEIRGFTAGASVRISRIASWFGAVALATRPGPVWMRLHGWHQTEWQITRERWQRRAGPDWRRRRRL